MISRYKEVPHAYTLTYFDILWLLSQFSPHYTLFIILFWYLFSIHQSSINHQMSPLIPQIKPELILSPKHSTSGWALEGSHVSLSSLSSAFIVCSTWRWGCWSLSGRTRLGSLRPPQYSGRDVTWQQEKVRRGKEPGSRTVWISPAHVGETSCRNVSSVVLHVGSCWALIGQTAGG